MKLSAITFTLLAAALLFGCLGSNQSGTSGSAQPTISGAPTAAPSAGVTGTPREATLTPTRQPAATEEDEIAQALEDGSLDSQADDNSAQELVQISQKTFLPV